MLEFNLVCVRLRFILFFYDIIKYKLKLILRRKGLFYFVGYILLFGEFMVEI